MFNMIGRDTSMMRSSLESGGGSTKRVQQGSVQQHVQQVPVYRTVQVQERFIEIPQIHVVKEYVPKIEIVERIREVPKIEYQVVERIVEVPQIQWVDKIVEKVEKREVERYVPKIEVVEVVREVPKVEYEIVEVEVEVPQVQYVDKIVEVPQIQEVVKHVPRIEVVNVPIRREVRVPKVEVRQVEEIREVEVIEVIDVPVEKEVKVKVPVPQIQRIERPVPGPLKIVDVEIEVRVPKQVEVPQYIDVPVTREIIKEVPVPRQVPRYKDIEVPVEVEQIVTVPIERKVSVPRTVYKYVEEIKRVEVPYDVQVTEEVEELIEIVHEVQPVIEPIVHTRYEKLPPIREKGKAVYVNGPSLGGTQNLPPPSVRSTPSMAGGYGGYSGGNGSYTGAYALPPLPFNQSSNRSGPSGSIGQNAGQSNSLPAPPTTFASSQTPLMQPVNFFGRNPAGPVPQPYVPSVLPGADPEITRINAAEDDEADEANSQHLEFDKNVDFGQRNDASAHLSDRGSVRSSAESIADEPIFFEKENSQANVDESVDRPAGKPVSVQEVEGLPEAAR